jgi:hypothetical protein
MKPKSRFCAPTLGTLGCGICIPRSAGSVVLLLLVALVSMAGSGAVAAETWTDDTGRHQVEGEFLALRDEMVYLLKENGVTIAVPMKRLSTESQLLARRLATALADDDEAPDAQIRAMMGRLQSGDFGALWDSLPPSYQADINEVVQTFGQNMDTEIWNAGKRVVGKAVSVLRDKKEWILGYSALEQLAAGQPAVDANWDAVVGLLDAIFQSDLTDLNQLKTFDGAAFMEGAGKAIGERLVALAEAFQEDLDPASLPVPIEFPGLEVVPRMNFANAQITTVRVEGDTAVLRIEQADGEAEEHQAVRVEGKWLPKDMVDDWDEGIQQAKEYLTTMMPQQLEEAKPMLLSPLSPVKIVEGVLDQLLAANDQQAFNEVIDGIMEMAGGMLGFDDDMEEMEEVEEDDEAMDPFGAPQDSPPADSLDDLFGPPASKPETQ